MGLGTRSFSTGKQLTGAAFAKAKASDRARAAASAKPAARPVARRVTAAPKARPKAKARKVSAATKSRQRAAAAANRKSAAFRAKQAKESKRLEAGFREFRTGLEPLDILRQRLSGELGIPELQAQLDPLQQEALQKGRLLLDLPESIRGRTRGSLITQAGLDKLQASESADINKQLRDIAISQEFFAGQLTGARGELSEQLGVTQTQREFDLRAFGAEADLVNTRLARELTGFTTDLQREFEAIIGDITRAEQLSDDKVQRAFELAKLEKSAALEAQNIRLRSSLSSTAEKDQPTKREKQAQSALRQLGQLLRVGAPKSSINTTAQSFAGQFPEFSKDFFDLAKGIAGEEGPF